MAYSVLGSVQSVLSEIGFGNASLSNATQAFAAAATSGRGRRDPLGSILNAAVAGIGSSAYSPVVSLLLQFGALSTILGYFTNRSLFTSLYSWVTSRFVLTVHFESEDAPYLWLITWLLKQGIWDDAREIQVSTDAFGLGSQKKNTLVEGEDTRGQENAKPLSLLPVTGTSHTMRFRGTLIRVTRARRAMRQNNGEDRQIDTLTISMLTWSRKYLHALLLEAKEEYKAESKAHVIVHTVSRNNWNSRSPFGGSAMKKPKRSIDSVIIPQDTKEMLLEDCRDFLDSREWYGDRGIPWQRGWLLYGSPGSGKTSIIQALAGELDLPIYILSLSQQGMFDQNLLMLMNAIPERSIILMEDIDVALSTSMNRDDKDTSQARAGSMTVQPVMGSGLTLSGLLNALDGVQTQQGRLIFATTNKYESLDEALVRPGRLDVHIEFKPATGWQAKELFKRFYPTSDSLKKGSNNISEKREMPLANGAVTSENASPSFEKSNGEVQGPATASAIRRRRREMPPLTIRELEELAEQFAKDLPEDEFTMAAIQGHLMVYKTDPWLAISKVPVFVQKERERKARIAGTREKNQVKEQDSGTA